PVLRAGRSDRAQSRGVASKKADRERGRKRGGPKTNRLSAQGRDCCGPAATNRTYAGRSIRSDLHAFAAKVANPNRFSRNRLKRGLGAGEKSEERRVGEGGGAGWSRSA